MDHLEVPTGEVNWEGQLFSHGRNEPLQLATGAAVKWENAVFSHGRTKISPMGENLTAVVFSAKWGLFLSQEPLEIDCRRGMSGQRSLEPLIELRFMNG